MPNWEGSSRKDRLPANWLQLRQEVFAKKGRRCYIVEDGHRCTSMATEVDHRIAGDDHSLENLEPICSAHHRSKSSSEGWQAMNRKKKQARERAEKKFGWAEERPAPVQPFKHPWQH